MHGIVKRIQWLGYLVTAYFHDAQIKFPEIAVYICASLPHKEYTTRITDIRIMYSYQRVANQASTERLKMRMLRSSELAAGW